MSDSPDENPLGRAVASRRAALGLKRKDLAQRARLSYPYISEIENGVKEPSAKALRQIADGLDLSVAELATLAESVEHVASSDPGPLPIPGVEAPPEVDRARQLDRIPGSVGASLLASPPNPPAAGSRDEEIRFLVREELERWAATRLPELIRSEVDRAISRNDEGRAQ